MSLRITKTRTGLMTAKNANQIAKDSLPVFIERANDSIALAAAEGKTRTDVFIPNIIQTQIEDELRNKGYTVLAYDDGNDGTVNKNYTRVEVIW